MRGEGARQLKKNIFLPRISRSRRVMESTVGEKSAYIIYKYYYCRECLMNKNKLAKINLKAIDNSEVDFLNVLTEYSLL